MSKLKPCIKMVISEGRLSRDLVDDVEANTRDYIAQGMKPRSAAIEAIDDMIGELKNELADYYKQIGYKERGKNTSAPLPKQGLLSSEMTAAELLRAAADKMDATDKPATAPIKWQKPTRAQLEDEWKTEDLDTLFFSGYPTPEDSERYRQHWLDNFDKFSSVETVNPKDLAKQLYITDSSEQLAKNIQHMNKDVPALKEIVSAGSPFMPILIQKKDMLKVLGGRTRMSLAGMAGQSVQAAVIDEAKMKEVFYPLRRADFLDGGFSLFAFDDKGTHQEVIDYIEGKTDIRPTLKVDPNMSEAEMATLYKELRAHLGQPAKEYKYAMVNRPYGIGTAPKEGFVRTEPMPEGDHRDYARNGVAVYNRELTDAETKQFEMAPMADQDQLAAAADMVAKSMGRYAAQYAEMAKTDSAEFERTVMDRLKSKAEGYPPSVGDVGKFAGLVAERLADKPAETKEGGVTYELSGTDGDMGTESPRAKYSPGQVSIFDIKPRTETGYKKLVGQFQTGTLRTATTKIESIEDVAHVLAPLRKEAQEANMALVVDKDNNILSVIHHTKGGPDSANIYVSTLLGNIHATPGAAKFWMVHNHPSGSTILSAEDKNINNILERDTAGTGLEMGEMLVIAGDTASTADRSFKMEPRLRKNTVPVTGSRIIGRATGESILSSDQAKAILADKPNGLLLLNVKNQEVGYIEVDAGSIRKDAGKILKAIAETNTVSVIGKTDTNKHNLISFAAQHNIKILDVIVGGESSADKGYMPSREEIKRMMTDGAPFYSRTSKPTGTTVTQVETELRAFLKKGYDKLTGSGKLRVVQSVAELPENIGLRSKSESGNVSSMPNKRAGDISTEQTQNTPEGGEILSQQPSKQFFGDNGKEYTGVDASASLSLVPDDDFKNLTGVTKKEFQDKGGTIYFVPEGFLGNGELGGVHPFSGEIVLADALSGDQKELKNVLVHELTHWEQIQSGTVPTNFYVSPEESIHAFMEYLSDPAEVKARFNAEGKTAQEYEDFMEQLSFAKSVSGSRGKPFKVGETKIEERKAWRMTPSYLAKEIEAAKTGRKYRDIPKKQLRENIAELDGIIGAGAKPGLVPVEEIHSQLDLVKARAPLSDNDASNVNTLQLDIAREWQMRRLGMGAKLSDNDIEYYQSRVLRVEVEGAQKRGDVNPVIIEGVLREAGIDAFAVGPNEIQITLNRRTAEKLASIGEAFHDAGARSKEKLLPNRNSPPIDGGDVTLLYSKDGSIAGTYDPRTGQITLVADTIKPGDAEYVMLHEGGHALMREDPIFAKQYTAIIGQFSRMKRYDYRVQDAYRKVPGDTPAHQVDEEALMYFLEEKKNHATSLFKKVIANIRAWLFRMGIPMKNLTTDDLVALFTQGVKSMARGGAAQESFAGNPMVAFSKQFGITVEEAQRQYDEVVAKHKGKDTWMKAPNGQPTKLNERQWVQTRTDAFKEWFGDWQNDPENASKAVDHDTGEPMVVYHGTGKKFNIFSQEFAGQGITGESVETLAKLGFYFSDSFDSLRFFGENNVGSFFLNVRSPFAIIGSGSSQRYKVLNLDVDQYINHKGNGEVLDEDVHGTVDALEYLREMAEDTAGGGEQLKNSLSARNDGVVLDGTKDLDGAMQLIVFSPNQIKSATGNTGQFGQSGDIRLSVREAAGLPADLLAKLREMGPGKQGKIENELPIEERWQKVQRVMQDKYNRWGVIKEWAEKQGFAFADASDVPAHLDTMNGRIADQLLRFMEQTIEPLLERAAKIGATYEQIEEFLLAQHAEEANARAQKLHDDPDALAYGMTDEQAATIMATRNAEFKALANDFRKLSDDTLDMQLKAGVISQDSYDAMKGAYKLYVPVRGGEEDIKRGTGKGLTVARDSKRRGGHGEREEHVLENIVKMREFAVRQIEKNKTALSIKEMLTEMADDRVGTVGKPELTRVFKDKTSYTVLFQNSLAGVFDNEIDADRFVDKALAAKMGKLDDYLIKTSTDPRISMMATPLLADNEIAYYEGGKRGRIQLNDEGLAKASTHRDLDQLGTILQVGRTFNNYLSRAYTGYDPRFTIRNTIRDFTAGMINMTGDYGIGIAGKVTKAYPAMVRELWSARKDPAVSKWVDMYRQDGGSTGASYLPSIDRLGNKLQNIFEEKIGAVETYKKVYAEQIAKGKTAKMASLIASSKSGLAGLKKVPVLGHALKVIERMNAISENAFRLAVYKTVYEQTNSRLKAAQAAKNSTLNFDKKGELGPQLSALWLFYNPAAQSMHRTLHTLLASKHKHQAQALVGSMVMTGLIAAMAFGDDDDEWDAIPNATKNRNLILGVGGGVPYITLPLPYEYGAFVGIGYAMADAMRGKATAKTGVNLASAIVEGMSPFGNPITEQGNLSAYQMMPTAVQMITAPETNMNSFGGPIAPKKFDEGSPDFKNMWKASQGSAYASIARGLTKATGGNDYEAGVIDVSPETLKYYARGLMGGAFTFMDQVLHAGRIAAAGEAPDLYETPMVNVLGRKTSVRDYQSKFFEEAAEIKRKASAYKDALKNRDFVTAKEIGSPSLLAAAKKIERISKMVGAKRKAISAIRMNDSLSFEAKRRMITRIEEEEKNLLHVVAGQ